MEKELEQSGESLAALIGQQWEIPRKRTMQYSPLVLAYIGDAVFDLVVRTILVEKTNEPVNVLHKKSAAMVKATAQTELYHRIEEMLSEDEMAVFKRGRNAKSHTTAKNASVSDYRCATGVEALIGYLYLEGNMERILELLKAGLLN